MLPFNKRPRSSVYEIDPSELEPVDLPPVSAPPSARFARPAISFSRNDDERTLLLPQKRSSSAPPPRVEVRMPRIPGFNALPKFTPSVSVSDEVTMVRPGPRTSLLSMKANPVAAGFGQSPRMSIGSMVREELTSSLAPEGGRRELASRLEPTDIAPQKEASQSVPAMAMPISDASGATVLTRNHYGRPTAVWAMALLALGLFGGLLTSVIATRGDVAKQDVVRADIQHAAAQVQAPAASPQQGAAPPAVVADAVQAQAPSCGVDPLLPPTNPTAKATAIVAPPIAPTFANAAPIAKPIVAPPARVTTYVPAAKPVVASKPVAPKADAVAIAAPAKAAPRTSKKALGDDLEQANAADALARAQLEAALNR